MKDLAEILGKNYQLEKEIGRGGMGAVYLATDLRLDRKVAVKVLTLESDNEKAAFEEVIQRFQREAKAIAKLNHTNIVNVYDLGEANNKYYMIMEYLEGRSLSDILEEKGKIDSKLAISIGIQICDALNYAHDNGIIHRDIKPANIILSKKGIAKLTDFGIAQLSKEQKKLTQAGAFLGSLMYIPPEQLEDASTIDHRADIYSLGVTLYELLTGVLPFDSDNISKLFMQILTEKPKTPSLIEPSIPSMLDMILEKALEKKIENRFKTANDMGLELAKLNTIDSEISENTSIGNFFSMGDATVIRSGGTGRLALPSNTSKTNPLKKTTIDKLTIAKLRKNYEWLNTLVKSWKSESITRLSLDQVIAKVSEPSLYGKAFTGALIINKKIYTFVYDGYFIAGIDILTESVGDSVFEYLPKNPETIELRIPQEDDLFSTIIIASIINNSGEAIHKDLDSSLVNLVPLLNNLIEEAFSGYISCYTEKNVFYYGFDKGKQIFSSVVSSNKNEEEKSLELQNLILEGVIFNAYNPSVNIMGTTISNLLKETDLKLKYIDKNKANLYNIIDIGEKEVPIHIIKEVKQNTILEFNLTQASKINIQDKYEIDLLQTMQSSTYYQFSKWLINEYFYLLNSSLNTSSLKYIYTWIPAIEYFKFFESLQGEDGNMYDFSLVMHGEVRGENYKKVLMLVRFGNGDKEHLDKFINDTIQVKKKLIKSGDIGGAIYVSTEDYSSDSLKLFYERTVEPRKGFSLASLDNLTKYKGFVRIGFGRGFHLNLIEYKKDENGFSVIAPLLK